MFCSNCGKQNMEGAKFCAGCGTPMMVVDEVNPIQQQAPVYFTDTPVAPAPQKPNKNKKGLIIGIVVGVIVVIVAVIGILFATGVFETDSDTEDTKIEETKKEEKTSEPVTEENDNEVIFDSNYITLDVLLGDGYENGEVTNASPVTLKIPKTDVFDDYGVENYPWKLAYAIQQNNEIQILYTLRENDDDEYVEIHIEYFGGDYSPGNIICYSVYFGFVNEDGVEIGTESLFDYNGNPIVYEIFSETHDINYAGYTNNGYTFDETGYYYNGSAVTQDDFYDAWYRAVDDYYKSLGLEW